MQRNALWVGTWRQVRRVSRIRRLFVGRKEQFIYRDSVWRSYPVYIRCGDVLLALQSGRNLYSLGGEAQYCCQ